MTQDCNCTNEHLPALSPGMDELSTARDAYKALEDLVNPVVADRGVNMHLVGREELTALLAVLNFFFEFNLSRADAEYRAARRSP